MKKPNHVVVIVGLVCITLIIITAMVCDTILAAGAR